MTMNQTYNTNELYRTADLSLTAALSCLGFVIQDVEQLNSRRAVFTFENTRELAEAVARYWRREIKVEPQDFFNELKTIKTRIYER
ncbi:MAG: hypothetical protein COU07_01775 [Candidatus Harrisonbacteria bacterium CG10_big_fil_rev_8_21_14_0_10_40_38]|uniref:DUF5659 domain-containing protein n=1 Tax=Candidatus Harrisonbacteria bacterium CG10_big_fil_rev_8_21_14_0_10_40_38 TaxID=1974583 RepID=A0A2H0UV09_9BACT|nr:MAG: hypothetical protein COU07_01775 [Candidatus Harrisonbacteria bacterium CG10_big_fil_rev_8_21_14_0_10_40_38]